MADLDAIRRYVERDRPLAAARLVSRLLDAAESLAEHPERGSTPRDARLRELGYRVVFAEPYVLFYKIGLRVVRVYRVLHGHRRFEGLL
jgi:plasmid stabilization system protein ParE